MLAREDRRSWSRQTIDEARHWYYPVPGDCWTLLERHRRTLAAGDRSIWMQTPPASLVEQLRLQLRPVREELEHGRGFVILTGLKDSPLESDREFAYWHIGFGLGDPLAQNIAGTLLYDVRDTGQDVRQGARFSVTNSESSFHTDNSFGQSVADYVGLLCLQPAKAGGVSQMVNAFRVIEALAERSPEGLALLQQEFHFDRRGGVRAGEPPTVQFPVLFRRQTEWVCRYLRYWIEAGHEKAQQPLTSGQQAALEALDAVLREPDLRVEFELRSGEMYFLNNRRIFHNRTGFEDYVEPDRKRHLVRLWLEAFGNGETTS